MDEAQAWKAQLSAMVRSSLLNAIDKERGDNQHSKQSATGQRQKEQKKERKKKKRETARTAGGSPHPTPNLYDPRRSLIARRS